MVGDLLVSWIISLFYTEYNSLTMSISALGNNKSPIRLQFNLWMLIEGVLFLTALLTLYKYYSPVSKIVTNTVVTFIVLFAVGACIFTCFFSVNETKDVVTTASRIHGIGSVIGFMVFLFVSMLISILSFKNGERMIGIVGMLCFVIAFIFFILFVMADKPKFSNTIIHNEGLWQRLNLVFMYLPLCIIALKRIM